MECPACRATVLDGARFCSTCGHAVTVVADERRVVTVLFADLVGFTTLSESTDPEQVKNVVDRCFQRLAAAIESYGGKVDKIIGDAIVALFGAPVAHEDDAERAVRAALRMQELICDGASDFGAELELRVGVNTGEVLVGALRAGGSTTAMGDVVNVAQRLEVAAAPGDVLVGSTTRDNTGDGITYDYQGSLELKGRGETVDAWIATGAALPPGHRRRRDDGPLVGRRYELAHLTSAIDTAITNRRAQFLLLVGDAGVGKSRLANELATYASITHDAVVLEGRCVPYGEANVWWPVAEALRQAAGIEGEIDAPAVRVRLGEMVAKVLERPGNDAEVAAHHRGPAPPDRPRGPAAGPRPRPGPGGGHLGAAHRDRGVRRPFARGGDPGRPPLGGPAGAAVHRRPHGAARPAPLRRRGHRPPRHPRPLVAPARAPQLGHRPPRAAGPRRGSGAAGLAAGLGARATSCGTSCWTVPVATPSSSRSWSPCSRTPARWASPVRRRRPATWPVCPTTSAA